MRSQATARSFALALGAALLVTGAFRPAAAGLGETVGSVQSDLAKMKGQLRVKSAAGYSVQEITTPAGTLVREYVSPAGVVFAVSWRGPVVPDLRQTLGSYFPQLQAAENTQRLGHHHLEVRQSGLVVRASGHMRAFFGMAYVPGLLPPNFAVSDIQ